MLDIRPEVARALRERAPVVALETALVSHGLPAPDNLRVAREAERAVREAGAVPATIGVVGGAVRVGLDEAELEVLATAGNAAKCSTRDLPRIVTAGVPGGTTVAATIFVAARAGIAVMATGGIGGVHRGGEQSLDVSADLDELARSPVLVVCAGAKAILDLPRTLERLETLGVPVVGFRSREFPAFYSASSGLDVPSVETAAAAAALVRADRSLGLPGGVVLANPPPAEVALSGAAVEALVEAAREAARTAGVRGAAETPFLLRHIAVATGGATVCLNEALVLANARLAAEVSVALCRESP